MFTNTPREQKLEVERLEDPKDGATDDEVFVEVGPGTRTQDPI